MALLSQAIKSECGTAQPNKKIRVLHCTAKLKNPSVALRAKSAQSAQCAQSAQSSQSAESLKHFVKEVFLMNGS